jgi:uncharacterized coiled-coil DUF342 family protein
MQFLTKIKVLVRTLIDVIKAYSEFKRVSKELDQVRQQNETLRERNLELAEEAGKLKGELAAKSKEIQRLNREMAWKDDEIMRLQQKITSLETNFEEKVRVEAERRLHHYISTLIREIKEDFVSRYLFTTWTIPCDKCHSKFSTRLTSDQIAELIRDGYTYVECINKNCVDEYLFRLIRYPHRIPVKLEDFVKAVMKEKFAEIYKGVIQQY